MYNHGSQKKPRILILGQDWRPFQLRSFPKTITDLVKGNFVALDKWKVPYDFTDWNPNNLNSGWSKWKQFSQLLLSLSPQERGLDWEFFHLADIDRTPIAYPQICVVHHKVKNWKRGRSSCPDDNGIFLRDAFCCAYCGIPITIGKRDGKFMSDTATIDHIVPSSKWDKWAKQNNPKWTVESWQNKCCACFSCNHDKGSQMNDEIGYKLRTKAYMPSWTLHQGVKVAKHHIKESWLEYLYPDSIKLV